MPAVKIALKGTEGVLSKAELMLAQMVATASVTMTVGLATDRASFFAIARMDAPGWGCFFGLAIGVYLVGNASQIVATRAIGASNHSASNSLRLLSAGLGSWLLLDEPIDHPTQWAGLVTITLALAVFWFLQRRDQQSLRPACPSVDVGRTSQVGLESAVPDVGGRVRTSFATTEDATQSQKQRYAKLRPGDHDRA